MPGLQFVVDHLLLGMQRRSEDSLPQERNLQELAASGMRCWLESGAVIGERVGKDRENKTG